MRIEIDNIWCKGCGLCVRACKKGVLAIGTERSKGGYLMPYAKKSNEGLFIVKDFYYGYGQIAHHTLITPNGKLLFMRLASRIRESA